MAGGASEGGGPITGINVTPLVDVMMVLLIIFMVTAKLVVAPANALGVKLTRAASGGAVQVVFSIQLTREGASYVDGHAVSDEGTLLAQAQQALAAHPDLRAVIQADAEVPHGRVIHVMDLLSQAHVTNIAFAVEAPRTPAGTTRP